MVCWKSNKLFTHQQSIKIHLRIPKSIVFTYFFLSFILRNSTMNLLTWVLYWHVKKNKNKKCKENAKYFIWKLFIVKDSNIYFVLNFKEAWSRNLNIKYGLMGEQEESLYHVGTYKGKQTNTNIIWPFENYLTAKW